MLSSRTVLLGFALYGTALSAQQTPLVGAWRITYPGELRMRNGVADPVMVNGTLTFQTQGDSLVAELVTDPSPDLPPRPTLRLAARSNAGDPVFVTRSKATLRMNGSEREATVVNTWTFGVKGDSLAGSVDRKLEGVDAPGAGPLPITGSRRKG